jgi:FkbM family methyltransferase
MTTTCNVKGHQIQLCVDSPIEEFRANSFATKEPETLEWIERFFRPGDTFYDVGANIGQYSLYAARIIAGICTVYAFEPEALNYAQLSKNIYLNGLSSAILPCNVAITDRLCFGRLNIHPQQFSFAQGKGSQLLSGAVLHSFGTTQDCCGNKFQPVHCQGTVGVDLDFLWKQWGFKFPNHLKVDVDGLEEKVFQGALSTLFDPRLRSVLVEVSKKKGDADPIANLLLRLGFVRVTDFSDHSSRQLAGSPYEDSLNTVFVRG